jgi:enediyne polyketide synthase
MPAAESFKRELSSRTFQPATRRVFSTVTGSLFRADTDVASHLAKQIINPVLFEEAANQAAQESDLFLDLGSEGVLAGMIAAVSRHPVIVWNPRSAKGILQLAAALFVNGSPVDLQRLSQFRYVRNFSLDGPAEFLRNPCSAVNSVPQRRNMQRTDLPSARMSNNARLRPEETRTHSIESAGSRVSPVNTLLKIVSRKTELPQTQLSSSMNLLSDLHLSSIAVAEIAIEAAKSLGKKPLLMPTGAATMTIGELAVVLEESCEAAVAADEAPLVGGIDAWVGLAVVELNPVVRLQVKINSAKISDWTIRGATSPKAREIATAIAEKLTGDGVLLLYDASTSMDTVLRTAQEICQTPRHLLVVCDTSAPSISAFIRSLALEASSASIYLLKVDFSDESIQQIIIDSSWQTARFTECHFIEGKPFAPTLRFLPPSIGAEYLLESSDLMLVLGGGKGIAAECAFQIARKYGLSLALVGRSSPSGDEELDTNLSRLAEYGIRFRYWRADATDPIALSAVVREIEGELGSITAIMHAAGLNEPKSLATMTIADIERALLPKMQPLEILNGCLDFSSLKAFIAFGSIISRIGFHGEAHYAHSNEAMRERLEVLAKVHEKCRFLCLEWTVWSGLGMGKRLARLDRLTRDGIAPLTPEIGTAALIRLLESNIGATSVVITSRIPSLPTLKIQKTALRPSRFLERILINYPEIEFVAEAVLAIQKDLYLNDHKLDGAAIFPAALGLEAMTQAAIALFGGRIPTALLDVQFAIPITVGQDKGTTIRILALRRTAETAEIVIRSSQTDFQVDHFRAVCSIDPAGAAMSTNINPAAGKLLQIPELYDTILFQNGRFQIVSGYVEALAHRSCAVLSPTEQPWFSQFLPQSMSLINPSITDAAMHSIQACIPHRRLLPVSIDRMTTYPTANLGPPFRSRAIEICAKGSDFVYDVEITDQYGNGIQRMDGLRLHSISENDPSMFRTPQLIANMLERRWCELSDDGAQVFLHEEPEGGRSFERLPGRRADGKPIHIENAAVRAWSDGVLLQLLSSQDGACDIERVEHREPQMWRDLLGESLFQSAAFLAQRHGEEFDLATTRFWTIMECLKKLGRLSTGSVVSEQYTHEGWTLSRCGEYNIGTVPITLSGSHFVVAFAANSKRLPLTESEVTHALLRV